MREFSARGLEIVWFSSNTAPAPEPIGNRVCIPVAACNIVERLTQVPYPIWSLRALGQLWTNIGQADVVHVHEHLYIGSIMGTAVARLRNRPLVITQHSSLGLDNPLLTALYRTGARILGWLIFPAAASTVFISANVRRIFRQQSNPRSRLLFNGIDTNRFTHVSAERQAQLRLGLGLPADRRIALFVGRFVRKKGLGIVRALSRQLPDVEWVFIGWGPEHPQQWQQANVRVVGRIGHDELPAYYQSCDLLILPSYGEGFPLVVQEALACGLAVLSTEEVASACPEATAMIHAMPTPRGDVDVAGWTRAIQSLLADEQYLEARAARAERSRLLWSWDGCASSYIDLFRQVQTKRHSRPM